jgi:hypothetical protein
VDPLVAMDNERHSGARNWKPKGRVNLQTCHTTTVEDERRNLQVSLELFVLAEFRVRPWITDVGTQR